MKRSMTTLLKIPGMNFFLRQPIAYVLGLFGLGTGLTDMPLYFQIPAMILGLIILFLTAWMKYEEVMTRRSDRLEEEEAEELRDQLADRAEKIDGVTSDDILGAYKDVK